MTDNLLAVLNTSVLAEPFAPKSDDQDDLGRRVSNFLRSRHFDSFQDLNIEVHDGAVVVSGKLENYHEKQVALSCCQRVAGVITLVDKIKVTKPTS